MLYSKVLVAYDGSELGNKALEKAIEMAIMDASTEIVVLHVLESPMVYSESITVNREIQLAIEQKGDEVVQQAEAALQSIPNKSAVFKTRGFPAGAILEHAESNHCDLIIMGSRGLSGLKEFFLGSVSHHVVQRSHVPVLIVK